MELQIKYIFAKQFSFLSVPALSQVQFVISSFRGHQLTVCALFHDTTVMEHEYAAGVLYRWKTMSYDETSSALLRPVQSLLNDLPEINDKWIKSLKL